MNVDNLQDDAAAQVAAAIGEPARARMLYSLMDGHARTSTELSAVADIGPSTASAHLSRLLAARLVTVAVQGRHRYYALAGREVAAVLESLVVLTGTAPPGFAPSTPPPLRAARTCYDHLAGAVGVSLHDRLHDLGLLETDERGRIELTREGEAALAALDIDAQALRRQRRQFACACLDWSERRPHLGGALGAALLAHALDRRWMTRELDGRALAVTPRGAREFARRFGMSVTASPDA